MKKYLCISLIFLYLNSYSQKSFYAEIGLTASKMCPLKKEYSDIKTKYFPDIGISIRKVIVSNILYLHYGIAYNRIGEKLEKYNEVLDQAVWNPFPEYEYDRVYSYDNSYNLYIDYLKLPLKIEAKWYNIQLIGGVFFSRALGGKMSYSYNMSNSDSRMETEYNLKPETLNSIDQPSQGKLYITKWNYGYVLSIGYKYEKFGVLFSYERGLRFVDYRIDSVNPSSWSNRSSFEYRYQCRLLKELTKRSSLK